MCVFARGFWCRAPCISPRLCVSVSGTVGEGLCGFSHTPLVPCPCAAWKALSSRGWAWAWAAFLGQLGAGARAVGEAGQAKFGRALPGAPLANRPGAFCPLLAALRSCTGCLWARGSGPVPGPDPRFYLQSALGNPLPTQALRTHPGPHALDAAFRPPPVSPTFPVTSLFLSSFLPLSQMGAPVAWPL